MRAAIVLKAAAAVATSSGPSSGSGGAFTSRPSASAAAARVRTGAVRRRTAHRLSAAAAKVIRTKAIRKVGEAQGRMGGTGAATFSQVPFGSRSPIARRGPGGPPWICICRGRSAGGIGTRFMLTRSRRCSGNGVSGSAAMAGPAPISAVRPGGSGSSRSIAARSDGSVITTVR